MLNILDLISSRFIPALLLLAALGGCGPQQKSISPIDETTGATTDKATDEIATQAESASGQSADEERVTNKEARAEDGRNSQEPTDRSSEQAIPKPIFPALNPGEYCYFTETEVETTSIRIVVEASDRVTGNVRGIIHNKANGYDTSYSKLVERLE